MIHLQPIFFVVAVLLLICGAILMVPAAYILVATPDLAPDAYAFMATAVIAAAIGIPTALATRKANFRLVPRQMYLLIVVAWAAISLISALPFHWSSLQLSVVDSLFEAVSGITTTGSTILTNLDTLPAGMLVWRALLQWVGGVGIIVMGIAILPHLRVGGMRLFRAEASDKSEKFTARSRNVARSIGAVYLALSVACALSYWRSCTR